MFIYQAVIMLAVISIIFVLAFVAKIRNRTILALLILGLVVAAGLSMSVIQDYFGNHFYKQKVDTSLYRIFDLNDKQKASLSSLLAGYRNINTDLDQNTAALEKTYTVNDSGVSAEVTVQVLLFKSRAGADEYFKLHQLIYESQYMLPDEPELTKKTSSDGFRYLTSYIRSNYKNYKDLIYLPSRIYYMSDTLIQSENLIVYVTERSNQPVSEKNKVFTEIARQLSASQ